MDELYISSKIKTLENSAHALDKPTYEEIEWLENTKDEVLSFADLLQMINQGEPIMSVIENAAYCDTNLITQLMSAKFDLGKIDSVKYRNARSRANVHESIGSMFFMNRAALKMANIDAIAGFMFTNIDANERFRHDKGPVYFADVCAGPGGFSEYVLWRKSWRFKGFGFTLRGSNDFTLRFSRCANDATFRAYYGEMRNGDVYEPENVRDFAAKIRHETHGQGVHFLMSDGGFSVDGSEDLQEVLSKRIYLSQCLVALEIIREHGHFVTKLFDTFTKFSVGLVYLMYKSFQKISIIKPKTSRPANSERYLICFGRKSDVIVNEIKSYLGYVHELMRTLKRHSNFQTVVKEIVNMSTLESDEAFSYFMRKRNETLCLKQLEHLRKIASFVEDNSLKDVRQDTIRRQCLIEWHIPDITDDFGYPALQEFQLQINDQTNYIHVPPKILQSELCIRKTFNDVSRWVYMPMSSDLHHCKCGIYIGTRTGCKVYNLKLCEWNFIKGLKLPEGTIVYGEMVTETCKFILTDTESQRQSLHVIDALCLGRDSLANLRFHERFELIKIFCEAVNFETNHELIRVRQKRYFHLRDFISMDYCELPILGCQCHSEGYAVNSLMFIKVDQNQMFNTTYVLRSQLFLRINDAENPLIRIIASLVKV